MAKRCIFCGKEFGLFGGCLIQCGDSDLSVCSACYDQLSPLSPKERAVKALATGRAPNPQELQAWLKQDEAWLEEERSRLERARQAISTDKTCLRFKISSPPSGWRWRSSGAPGVARRNSTSPSHRICPRSRTIPPDLRPLTRRNPSPGQILAGMGANPPWEK